MKETTEDPKKISESFIKYFTNIKPKITKKIPNCSKWFTDYLNHQKLNQKNCNNGKSSDPNSILLKF